MEKLSSKVAEDYVVSATACTLCGSRNVGRFLAETGIHHMGCENLSARPPRSCGFLSDPHLRQMRRPPSKVTYREVAAVAPGPCSSARMPIASQQEERPQSYNESKRQAHETQRQFKSRRTIHRIQGAKTTSEYNLSAGWASPCYDPEMGLGSAF